MITLYVERIYNKRSRLDVFLERDKKFEPRILVS